MRPSGVSVTPERPDLLLVRWDIAEGYYLYRDKFKVKLTEGNDVTLGSPSLPPGETKHDEFFGDVQIFHHEAEMRVPLKRASGGDGHHPAGSLPGLRGGRHLLSAHQEAASRQSPRP